MRLSPSAHARPHKRDVSLTDPDATFTGLSEADRALFTQLLQRIHVVGLSGKEDELIERIVRLRQECRLKLPDAIVAASALTMRASLLTADRHFYNVPQLQIVPC